MKSIYLFLGGAVVGAVAALLLAPESGEDTRARIKALLRKKVGEVTDDENELSVIMQQISSDLEEGK
ncbi:MAG: YtxH domain-containing protein [Bacteroidales bacterium]|nr:YtxH domain-containing protein [Bacteroidales bacterium]